jgi:hypothetical protein
MASCTLITRQEGSGSPQCPQSGGLKGRTKVQHSSQTGPRVGSSSGPSQAAQRGASSAASAPSASALISVAAATLVRQGCTISSLTSSRSAFPHSRSSE